MSRGCAVGRISVEKRSTTMPSRTFTSPTAHAEAALPLAVSKSIAVKSSAMSTMIPERTHTPDQADASARPVLPR